jgi:hypothetical protein
LYTPGPKALIHSRYSLHFDDNYVKSEVGI